MYFHQSLWRSERSRELKYNRTKTYSFPYKEAITNAYDLIDLTTTHVASRSLLYTRGKGPEEKAKGQSSIIDGQASVSGSSFRQILQSNS